MALKGDYLEITKPHEELTIALRYIYSIFLEPDVDIDLRTIDRIARHCRLFLIDGRGYLLGRYIHYEKV